MGSGVGSHACTGEVGEEGGGGGRGCRQEMGNTSVRGQVVSRAGWVIKFVSLWSSLRATKERTSTSTMGRGASSVRKPMRRSEKQRSRRGPECGSMATG